MRWFLYVAPLIVALATGQAWADNVKYATSCSRTSAEKICSFEIDIEGEITSSTVDDLKMAMAERDQMMKREGGSDFWSIHIDSDGGSVKAAIEIGRLLRSMDAPIEVSPDKICVGACVLVLAGATHRLLYGRVGIHRPYFETPTSDVNVGDVQEAYRSMTEQIRSFLREMNISDRLADDMTVVPPEKVRFLSSKDLVSYGLGFIDPVAKEASDLQDARKLGIDRREYMRRKALSNELCKFAEANGTYAPSQMCVTAVLTGKHVEKAPSCRNGASTCQPWERNWNGRKLDAGDIVTPEGFLISADK